MEKIANENKKITNVTDSNDEENEENIFLDQNRSKQETDYIKDHPSSSNILTVVSLKKLIKQAKLDPSSKEVTNFYNLGWIEGYVVDEKRDDILLYGRYIKEWPNITIYDFIDNLKNVYYKKPAPYCSLDPIPENTLRLNKYLSQNENIDLQRVQSLLGPQKSIVGGVPFNSRHAKVMLDADYHMKKVSQGKIRLKNIDSYLDFALKNDANVGGLSRFWFRNSNNSPGYIQATDIHEVHCCNIIVSTNAMETSISGELSDSKTNNPTAQSFAKNFSNHFTTTTTEVDCYAYLENLFRLQAVLRAMEKEKIFQKYYPIFSFFFKNYTYQYPENSVPKSYEGLVNELQSTNGDYAIYVMGGVSMESSNPQWHIPGANSTALSQKRDAILNANNTSSPEYKIDFRNEMKNINLLFIPYYNLLLKVSTANSLCSNFKNAA